MICDLRVDITLRKQRAPYNDEEHHDRKHAHHQPAVAAHVAPVALELRVALAHIVDRFVEVLVDALRTNSKKSTLSCQRHTQRQGGRGCKHIKKTHTCNPSPWTCTIDASC